MWKHIIIKMEDKLQVIFILEKSIDILQGKNHDWLLTLFEIHWITDQFPIFFLWSWPRPPKLFFWEASYKNNCLLLPFTVRGIAVTIFHFSLLDVFFQMRITFWNGNDWNGSFFLFQKNSKGLFPFFSYQPQGNRVDLPLPLKITAEMFPRK